MESPGVVNIDLDLLLSFRQGHFPYGKNNLQKNPVSFKEGQSGEVAASALLTDTLLSPLHRKGLLTANPWDSWPEDFLLGTKL